MTDPDLGEWTRESLRVAIAKAQGWKFKLINSFGDRVYHSPHTSIRVGSVGKDGIITGIPDYPGDLNAMSEARKVLHCEQRNNFVAELSRLVGNYNHWTELDIVEVFDIADAPALHQSLAFARTLNLKPEEN